MTYVIWIKATSKHYGLAPIEAGNPTRKFKTRTLRDAIALANVALFAAGDPMRIGPRHIEQGGMSLMTGVHVEVQIVRARS